MSLRPQFVLENTVTASFAFSRWIQHQNNGPSPQHSEPHGADSGSRSPVAGRCGASSGVEPEHLPSLRNQGRLLVLVRMAVAAHPPVSWNNPTALPWARR